LATGEVATFTIKVSVTTGSYTGLTVVDTLPAGLVYDNAWQLTGTRPNMETISFATGKNNQNLDTLTWKFKFPDTIKTGESFQIEMKTKLTESSKTVYTNKACVENPDGNIYDEKVNLQTFYAALTHTTYSNEHKSVKDFQYLEFLGDSIIQFFVTTEIYKNFPNYKEGIATNLIMYVLQKMLLSMVKMIK